MTESKPIEASFWIRFFLAFSAFWRILVNRQFATHVIRLLQGESPAPAREPEVAKPPALREAPTDSALQLLGLLQQEGRFVDFLEEDVSAYSDADIGAAARVVHEGCRKALREHIRFEPVRSEPEGSRLTLEQGFDASSVRLAGNVVGQPPFTGTLVHRGWRAEEVKLPRLAQGHDVSVLAPAEVEL
jgi:hypothetical protein